MALAGVGASIGDMLQNSLGASSSIWANSGFANRLVSGTAGAIAGAGAKSLIDGSDFGKNLRTLMPDAIGQTVGSMIAGSIAAAERMSAFVDAIDRARSAFGAEPLTPEGRAATQAGFMQGYDLQSEAEGLKGTAQVTAAKRAI